MKSALDKLEQDNKILTGDIVKSEKIGKPNDTREPTKSRKQLKDGSFYATGKRKSSIARIFIRKGKSNFTVNNKKMEEYFASDNHIQLVNKPLKLAKIDGQYDIKCTVKGGGVSGQAGAISHGITKAIDCMLNDEKIHQILKSHGLLTRDSRVVERKKYGKHKARKSTQFSKR